MIEGAWVVIVVAAVAGLYMAWNIGANDVANAMGTSVGSGALTHKQAILVAGVLEFAGAFLVGAHVTETVRQKMINPTDFAPDVLMIGMVAALLGAGTWLLVATWLGRPVSTTHSIVGAIAGFGLIVGGVGAVRWVKIGAIVGSWVVTPVISGLIAYAVFNLIEQMIINSLDPVAATRRWFPVFCFAVFFIMSLVTIFKGLKNLNLELDVHQSVLIAAAIGAVAAGIGSGIIRRAKVPEPAADQPQPAHSLVVERNLRALRERMASLQPAVDRELAARLEELSGELSRLAGEPVPSSLRPEFRFVERSFGWLQILSACFVAFAHGSNDVANAVGPLAAVVSIARTGGVAEQAPVETWILLLGGIGIVLGLATFGRRVMATIGERITHLTPSRGFSAEFAAATTIVVASRLGLPISTTHTLVGGVMGVGFARGFASLNPAVIKEIVIAWLIEVPAAALFAILFYYILQLIF